MVAELTTVDLRLIALPEPIENDGLSAAIGLELAQTVAAAESGWLQLSDVRVTWVWEGAAGTFESCSELRVWRGSLGMLVLGANLG